MSNYDLVIRNVRLVQHDADEPLVGSIAVTDGRIAAVGEVPADAVATTTVDGGGRLAFPGVVDAHQHWGIYNPLDVDTDSESRACAQGGVTTALNYMRTGQYYLNRGGSYAEMFPNRTGGTVKRLHCGWAAHSAVTAAQLVAAGFTGAPTVLEGRFGFFEAFLHGQADLAGITAGFGEDWAVPGIFFKPYPANHFTHAVIDAGIELRGRGIDLGRVSRITVGVPSAVIRTIGEPIEVKRAPETGYQAQFSGPYAVVAGLIGGGGLGVALSDYTDALAQHPERRRLMSLVDVEPDAVCDAIFPHQFPARVTVAFDDGSTATATAEVLANRGGSAWPLTDEELGAKFRSNAAGGIDEDAAAALERSILALDRDSRIADIIAPLRSTTGTSADLQPASPLT